MAHTADIMVTVSLAITLNSADHKEGMVYLQQGKTTTLWFYLVVSIPYLMLVKNDELQFYLT